MKQRQIQSIIRFSLYLSLVLITFSVTPFWNIDPINLPKFAVLCATAISIFPMLLTVSHMPTKVYRLTITVSMLFPFWMLLSFLLSEIPKIEQIFGTFGRNSGLLTYICLFIFLVSAIKVSRADFVSKLLHILSACGSINSFFCFLQWKNIGSEFWYNSNGQVIGTFGNQNFISSFLAISICATLALVMKYEPRKYQFILASQIIIQMFALYLTRSSQGMYILAQSLLLLVGFFVFESKSKFLKRIYIYSIALLSISLASGILGHGPLGKWLRQQSTEIRGDYWRAGWKMTKDNSTFGVGADGFGLYFRAFRDSKAAARDGASFSNSAHNIFLDLTTSGGITLGLLFLILILTTLYCAVRLAFSNKIPLYIRFGLIGSWLGWLLQSMISINQIALGAWGWILSGAIIGVYETRNTTDATSSGQWISKGSRTILKTGTGIAVFIGVILAVIPIFLDYKWRAALEQTSTQQIVKLSESDLSSGYYLTLAASYFDQIGQKNMAEMTSLIAVNRNIRDFDAWLRLLEYRKDNKEEFANILAQLIDLDPNFKI